MAKQIITPYHAAQKAITKDQHALGSGFFYPDNDDAGLRAFVVQF
ncbi:hypothetical protein VPUCM_2273 [Vibrio parahaemolyticus UCM-V493]|nr:hypothetical protein VPUCM_2273 [Vibrio parahaemolyticus UCM-V493]